MSKWLSDEEIEAMEDGGLGWTNGSYLHALCAQAKEANRLRAGLMALEENFEAESQETWRAPINRLSRANLAKRIRELLEGGE